MAARGVGEVIFALAAMGLLAGCAPRPQAAVPQPSAAITRDGAKKVVPAARERNLLLVSKAGEDSPARPHRPSPAPRPAPTASERASSASVLPRTDFSSLVRRGLLESRSPGQWAFVPSAPRARQETTGLFEDAIVLSSVRASLLRQIPGAQEEWLPSVRVQGGVVFLEIPPGVSAQRAAEAVDAALEVASVKRVVVRERP